MKQLKEFGYSILCYLGIVTVVIPIAYTLVFLIRYQKIAQWTEKWSGGEFVAPAKRFNFNLLHGLGALTSMYIVPSIFMAILMSTIGTLTDLEVASAALIMSFIGLFATSAGLWGYWKLLCKYSKESLTPKGNAYKIGYGVLSLMAWATIAVVAVYGALFVLFLVIAYYLLKFILFACFSQEISVKSGGFFGGSKKVQATRNWDGSYTDINGNRYK